jgi:D-glycero-D-manno-heptose 1,7-bisphosphate phosphatase
MSLKRAVFLDRDGVLVEDRPALTHIRDVEVLPRVPAALRDLADAGFLLLVVSNQTVVARGLLSEPDVARLHARIEAQLRAQGAPALQGFYFCPHHPNATLSRYRTACACRKPRPGLLRTAALEHGVSLMHSFLVGDRITDVLAGAACGCQTVKVQTGAHLSPPIETASEIDLHVRPHHVCADLYAAARWIVAQAHVRPAPPTRAHAPFMELP